jgi:predicted NUDIX family NTP pyrophosphohydrolase
VPRCELAASPTVHRGTARGKASKQRKRNEVDSFTGVTLGRDLRDGKPTGPHASSTMARPISAGTLLFRWKSGALEVLIVHPSGRYNRRAPWSIPKGLPEPGESVESAARRETFEETGIVCGELTSIGTIDYTRSRKTVAAFAGPAPADAAPRCASWEVDAAEFVELARARELIHPDQASFLDRLAELSLPAPSWSGRSGA